MKSHLKNPFIYFMCGTLVFSAAMSGSAPYMGKTVQAAEVAAASGEGESNATLYDKMTGQSAKPDGFETITENPRAEDPYGYGVDVPFYLNKQSELALFATNNLRDYSGTQRSIKTYNLGSGQNVGNILDGSTPSESYDIPMSNGKQTKALNYVEMTAFDPTGSGRKDHLAVIGIHNEEVGNLKGKKSLYLYVYNKNGNLVSDYLKLGSMNWMYEADPDKNEYDNDSAWVYNAMNFLSITAGDYDGDQKDTLVIWGCFDDTDYGLQEIQVSESNSAITLTRKGTVSQTLLHDEYTKSGGTLATSHDWVDNKLCCSVDTGDVNGDKIDDLVVISFLDITTVDDRGRSQQTQMYCPYLTVSYGAGSSNTNILNKKDVATRVLKENGSESNYMKYLTCFAADVSTGDINGDGVDEITVAGLKNEVYGNLNEVVKEPFEYNRIQESKTFLAAYRCTAGATPSVLYSGVQNANEWTADGLYPDNDGSVEEHDQCVQQYCVKCVAINGKGNPEMVFVNGDLYSYSAGNSEALSKIYTGDYFTKHDNEFLSTGIDLTNTFMLSADAGNFDGNDFGREQVVYTFAVKVSGHEQYFMAAGILGGDFSGNTDLSGLAKAYYSTSMNTFETADNRDVYFPGDDNVDLRKAHLTHNYGLNYTICAIDNDEDGILVRYHDKGYVYSDPEILGVLQAAPVFDELDAYGANDNETTYSFEHTVSYEDTDSDEVSFGAGVTHGLEGTLGGYDVKAGYALNWSHEFTEGFSESQGHSFTALDEDAVVLYRTPVTLYSYQVKKNGAWSDENIVLSFPGTPAYSLITVDRYNEFAEYYNAKNKARMKELDKSESDAPMLALLRDTDTHKLYLNTGGDPDKYMKMKNLPDYVTVIQKKANEFSADTGSTTFNYTTEHYTGDTDSMSHGFSFELEIKFGLGVPGFVSSSAGAYASLEYMNGHSHSSTKSDAKGVEGSVSNANRTQMKAAGFTDAACDSYGYKYQMAKWDSPITQEVPKEDPRTGDVTMETENVPIYGYVLSDVKKPIYATIKAPDELKLQEGYGKTTSGAFRIYGDPIPTVTKTAGNAKIAYNETTRKLVVEPGLGIGTYPVELKVANGIPGREQTIKYNVKVEAPDYSDDGIVSSVEKMIRALPDEVDLLLSDEVYVKQARAAYDALTGDQKAKVSGDLKTRLEKAEAQIKKFKEQAAATQTKISETVPEITAAANDLKTKIQSGADVTAEINNLEKSYNALNEAYDQLSDEQKALVSDETTANLVSVTAQVAEVINLYDAKHKTDAIREQEAHSNQQAADAVISLINDVNAAKPSAIDPSAANEEAFQAKYQDASEKTKAAREAYNELTVQQKALVTNAADLVAAEKTLGAKITARRSAEVAQQDSKEVQECLAAIGKIPANITLNDEKTVRAAVYAYNKLSPEGKKKIDAATVAKLKAASTKMDALIAESKNKPNENPQPTVTQKAANTLKVKAKTVKVSHSKLKKKKQVIKVKKLLTVSKAQGKVTYKLKKSVKGFSINKKTGKLTIKKGVKKKTYKLKVSVTAAGNDQYDKKTKTVTVKVVVK
ncbi:MAG: hypothetical protein K5739_09295 [Lachnospiraceae bacterium]|nr:hypothetical protein [Lachnospiraceae bacterium]